MPVAPTSPGCVTGGDWGRPGGDDRPPAPSRLTWDSCDTCGLRRRPRAPSLPRSRMVTERRPALRSTPAPRGGLPKRSRGWDAIQTETGRIRIANRARDPRASSPRQSTADGLLSQGIPGHHRSPRHRTGLEICRGEVRKEASALSTGQTTSLHDGAKHPVESRQFLGIPE